MRVEASFKSEFSQDDSGGVLLLPIFSLVFRDGWMETHNTSLTVTWARAPVTSRRSRSWRGLFTQTERNIWTRFGGKELVLHLSVSSCIWGRGRGEEMRCKNKTVSFRDVGYKSIGFSFRTLRSCKVWITYTHENVFMWNSKSKIRSHVNDPAMQQVAGRCGSLMVKRLHASGWQLTGCVPGPEEA